MSSGQHLTPINQIDQVKARSVEERMSEIASVIEKRVTSRLRRELIPEVAEAYSKSPVGPHDDRTARVVRAFGKLPLADKEVLVPLGQDGPYVIGRLAMSQPGGLTQGSTRYGSPEDAFRAVFKSRWDRLK